MSDIFSYPVMTGEEIRGLLEPARTRKLAIADSYFRRIRKVFQSIRFVVDMRSGSSETPSVRAADHLKQRTTQVPKAGHDVWPYDNYGIVP
jgi:hypothetical protein